MPTKFEIDEIDLKMLRRKRVFKWAAASLASVLILGAGIGAAWYYTPPAMPETIEEATALVTSPRFTRLSDSEKLTYYDVIREQYGSLDREERRRLQAENQEVREAMREARSIMFREMLVKAAQAEGEFQMPFGRGRGGPDRGDRPEPTEEEKAQRAERIRNHISDRIANGDSQTNQLMREMFSGRDR